MDWGRKARIEREAAEWVVLIDSSDFNAPAAARCRSWLARSEDHRRAFQVAESAWTGLDQLDKLKAYPEILAVLTADSVPRSSSAPASGVSMDRRKLVIGAGAAGVALAAGSYWAISSGAAEAYETAIGEVRDLTLPDGTAVALNADTRIEARVRPAGRAARIVRGEAFFQIAARHDGAFTLITSSGSVEARNGSVLVKILADGARVSVFTDPAQAWRPAMFVQPTRVSIATPSDVGFGSGGVAITPISGQAEARRTLWREGQLAFDDTPLAEAVADVSRQTGIRFEFANPALGSLRIGGLIDARDVDGFLAMLHTNLAIEATRRPDGVIVLSGGR